MELTHLGKISNQPIERLELVPFNGRHTTVVLKCSEFTSLCPVTGQPDFAILEIEYIPVVALVETKSLKLYLWRFREVPAFNEQLVNIIADDFFEQVQPKGVRVTGVFHARGGISVSAIAQRGEGV